MARLALVVIALLLPGCTGPGGAAPGAAAPRPTAQLQTADDPPTEAEAFTRYTISAGEHASTYAFTPTRQDELRFDVRFDESARYESRDPRNQADVNKLIGLSDGGAHHHVHSARFGWRWYGGALQLIAYCYNDGQRLVEPIADIEPGEVYRGRLAIEPGAYVFEAAGRTVRLPRSAGDGLWRYRLYPYFGGDETAPHEVRIWLRDVAE